MRFFLLPLMVFACVLAAGYWFGANIIEPSLWRLFN